METMHDAQFPTSVLVPTMYEKKAEEFNDGPDPLVQRGPYPDLGYALDVGLTALVISDVLASSPGHTPIAPS
ncbi:hypothetical protein QCA50_019835 [Cerrena zonata]|uniref:Uncharacterized protein n=1 Tax=Cerrena zonata TaxID=2478898 RepID=A0AAW0FAK0_9APHY